MLELRHASGRERRVAFGLNVNLQTRDGAPSDDAVEGRFIVGHASVFDQWTTLYEGRYYTWREVVRKGAYRNAIKEKQDVRSLFNHDANFVLGRTTSGTLELAEDEVGLMTRTDAPTTQTIRDLVIAPIARKDVTGMSFAFTVRVADKVKTTEAKDGTTVTERGGDRITYRIEGERLIEEREILDVNLFDVSPVTYPAYVGSDVEMNCRSMPDLRELIAAKDVPHKRRVPTPRLDEARRLFEARVEAGAGRRRKAASGRGK